MLRLNEGSDTMDDNKIPPRPPKRPAPPNQVIPPKQVVTPTRPTPPKRPVPSKAPTLPKQPVSQVEQTKAQQNNTNRSTEIKNKQENVSVPVYQKSNVISKNKLKENKNTNKALVVLAVVISLCVIIGAIWLIIFSLNATCRITIETTNAVVQINDDYYENGDIAVVGVKDIVRVAVIPDNGYQIDKILVDDRVIENGTLIRITEDTIIIVITSASK